MQSPEPTPRTLFITNPAPEFELNADPSLALLRHPNDLNLLLTVNGTVSHW